MEEIIYYSELYDLYKNLLTKRQREYFEEYYFKNLSFGEIAQNYNISRNAVYNQVRLTKKILEEYEEKINLISKLKRIEKIIANNEIYNEIHEVIFE